MNICDSDGECPLTPGCKNRIRSCFDPAMLPVIVPVTNVSPIWEAKYCEVIVWMIEQAIPYGVTGFGLATEFHFRDTCDATAFKVRWL